MIKFGTGGWRAIIGDEFTKANVQLAVASLCELMKRQKSADRGICIGYDRRFLSHEAAMWAAEVAAACGVPCRLLNKEAPTPLIMFAVRQLSLPYGLAITASHNPALYNGVKIFTSGGRDASEQVTAEIEKIAQEIENNNKDANETIAVVPYEQALADGRIEIINPFNEYIDAILRHIDVDAIKNAGLKIALDPMHGVSQTSLRTILMTARCEVEVINERHDTLFGGRLPSPNVDTLRHLSQYVVEHHCNLGIATDGDADRIGVIGNDGKFLHPNDLLVLLYYYLLKYRGWTGPVVRNNSTTHLLDRVAEAYGQKCYEVPVGFKHISAKMIETDAIIGGESSGGLTVRGHIQGKDGIYAAALLAEMTAKAGRGPAELYDEITAQFGKLYVEDADYKMTPERKLQLKEIIFTDRQLPELSLPIDHVDYTDGCKIHFKNGGWAICRFSGTEPLLRTSCEMPEREQAQKIISQLGDFITDSGR